MIFTTLVSLVWAAWCLFASSSASPIAVQATLEPCVASGTQNCSLRFTATLSVFSGPNSTASTSTYRLTSAVDSLGQVYDILDTIEITLIKSRIEVRYPLIYERQYNAGPFETTLYASPNGRPFSTQTNPCNDAASSTGACTWSVDAVGNRVPFSNGFCCGCALSPFDTRSQITCNALGSFGQTAHCLNFGPLWYSAYSFLPASAYFAVDVVYDRCRVGQNSTRCLVNLATVSASGHSNCNQLNLFPGIAGDLTNSTTAIAHDIPVDLFPSMPALGSCGTQTLLDVEDVARLPSFAKHLLLAPLLCHDVVACGNRTTETTDHWLMVERDVTTNGSLCDMTGVSYTAFSAQQNRCSNPTGSCLQFQPNSLYDYSKHGLSPSYFLGSYSMGGEVIPNVDSGIMAFRTTTVEMSTVTVSLDALALQYVLRVAPGTILSVASPAFVAPIGATVVTVVQNTGDVASQFTVGMSCGPGLAPVDSQLATLMPGTISPPIPQTITFKVFTDTMGAAQYACVVSLRDQLFRLVDTRPVILVAIAPSDTPTPSPTTGVSPALTASPVPHNTTCPSNGTCLDSDSVDACAAVCPRFADLACFTPVVACHSTQVAWIAGLSASALALLGSAACVAVLALRCRHSSAASLRDLQCCQRGGAGIQTASKQPGYPPSPIFQPVIDDSLMRVAEGRTDKSTKRHRRPHAREHNHAIATASDSADEPRAVTTSAALGLAGPGFSSESDSNDDTTSSPRVTHGRHVEIAGGSQPAIVAMRPHDGVVSHQIHHHRHHRHSQSTAPSTVAVGQLETRGIAGGMPAGSNTSGETELQLAPSRSPVPRSSATRSSIAVPHDGRAVAPASLFHWQAISRGIATAVFAYYQQPSPENTTVGRGASTDRASVTGSGGTVVVHNPMNFRK